MCLLTLFMLFKHYLTTVKNIQFTNSKIYYYNIATTIYLFISWNKKIKKLKYTK